MIFPYTLRNRLCFNLEPIIDYTHSQTMRSYFLLTLGIHLPIVASKCFRHEETVNKGRVTSPLGGLGRWFSKSTSCTSMET